MNKYRLLFIGIICAIYILAYFIFISAGNVFQDFAFFHHFDEHLFPQINVIALRISTFAMILCVLRFFQSTKNQSIFTLTMLSCLIIILLVPISFESYPLISGLSHIVLNLMEPWRQFYIPTAFRATLEGIVAACCGLIDLSSIFFEDYWSQHLDLYHYFAYIGIAFFILFVAFFAIIHRSEKNEPMPTFESIRALVYKNPYVFIACLFGGVNQAVFSYSFLLEKEILPNISPQNYQYLLYIGSIVLPLLTGRLGDKKGIFFMLIATCLSLISVKVISAGCDIFHITNPVIYYILVFLEGGLVSSSLCLITALIGERLKMDGIFRAFAISNVIYGVGSMMAGGFFSKVPHIFWLLKASGALLDILLTALFWYFYRKEKLQYS